MTHEALNYSPEEQQNLALPRITYEVNLAETPFTVNFDEVRYAGFLKELGMSDKSIRKLKVKISGKNKAILGGLNKAHHNELTVYAGTYWNLFDKSCNSAKKAINGNKQELRLLRYADTGLNIKRFSDYIHKAPAERASEFTERLLLRHTNRGLNESLLHESRHASDGLGKLLVQYVPGGTIMLGGALGAKFLLESAGVEHSNVETFATGLVSVLALRGLIYSTPIDISEHRARNTQKAFANHPLGSNLLTITPKV